MLQHLVAVVIILKEIDIGIKIILIHSKNYMLLR